MGPPSSGGSTVGEALNILEGYELSAADRVRALHLMLEASRYSFADRNAYLADPDFFDVPLAGLLSDEYAAERRALIDPEHAATSPVRAGRPEFQPLQSTTHLAVADRHGTVVSYTFTIESTGGNGIVVPGYGFLLNNELTDFNYDSPTHPNRADARKRPRSSISPTIVTREGEPLLAVGSPGGSTITGTVLQVLLERLDLGQTLPEAIAQPRAVQRNTAAATGRAGVHRLARGPGAHTQYGHDVRAAGRDRRRDRHRVPAGRPHARGRGAGAPRRRTRRDRSLSPRRTTRHASSTAYSRSRPSKSRVRHISGASGRGP